jgi:hypothetical protein
MAGRGRARALDSSPTGSARRRSCSSPWPGRRYRPACPGGRYAARRRHAGAGAGSGAGQDQDRPIMGPGSGRTASAAPPASSSRSQVAPRSDTSSEPRWSTSASPRWRSCHARSISGSAPSRAKSWMPTAPRPLAQDVALLDQRIDPLRVSLAHQDGRACVEQVDGRTPIRCRPPPRLDECAGLLLSSLRSRWSTAARRRVGLVPAQSFEA